MKQLLTILAVLLCLSPVLAFGPNTHVWLTDQICNEATSANVKMCCTKHMQEFRAGCVLSDITVVYYYTNGGANYIGTHNWNFFNNVRSQIPLGDEAGFCFGLGIGNHLIEDAVSHNVIVPDAMTKYGLPNGIIHPVVESEIELQIIKNHPELLETTKNMFNFMLEGDGHYITWVQTALGTNNQLNVRNEIVKLKGLLGGNFYDCGGFSPVACSDQSSFSYSMWKIVQKMTFVVPSADENYIKSMVITQANRVYGSVDANKDDYLTGMTAEPHGFTKLKYASDFINTLKILGLGVIIVLGIGIVLIGRHKK
jgi:hypothetical protein